jgi:hypothetical protein
MFKGIEFFLTNSGIFKEFSWAREPYRIQKNSLDYSLASNLILTTNKNKIQEAE